MPYKENALNSLKYKIVVAKSASVLIQYCFMILEEHIRIFTRHGVNYWVSITITFFFFFFFPPSRIIIRKHTHTERIII